MPECSEGFAGKGNRGPEGPEGPPDGPPGPPGPRGPAFTFPTGDAILTFFFENDDNNADGIGLVIEPDQTTHTVDVLSNDDATVIIGTLITGATIGDYTIGFYNNSNNNLTAAQYTCTVTNSQNADAPVYMPSANLPAQGDQLAEEFVYTLGIIPN